MEKKVQDLEKENEALKKKLTELESKLVSADTFDDDSEYLTGGKKVEDDGKVLIIIVLGASGDLAKKKTFPALWSIYNGQLLPENTQIVGYARHKMSEDEFRKVLSKSIKVKDDSKENFEKFLSICHYHSTPDYGSVDAFKDADKNLFSKLEKGSKGSHRLFYLALPPTVFFDAAKAIKGGGLTTNGWNRLIVEKPFGRDLESSNKLSRELGSLFKEKQIFRIDHYLGKEMVQNLMVLRFANMVFEPIWNRHYIQNVRIVFKEDFGTEGRGGYFDSFGIIRDVMQNHLMQIFSLFAMEPPVSLSAEDVRDEKVKVLRSVPEIREKDVIVGQYVSDGKNPGYLDDEGVPKDSVTPTFAQAVLWINNARWDGVPFIFKTGKAVEEKKAEIRIQFRNSPGNLFPDASRNELVIRVQPDEAVYLKMNNKTPGLSSKLVLSDLDLSYKTKFSERYNPDAYERLIIEAIRGDHNLFVRNDELAEAWRIFTPLLHHLESNKVQPHKYKFGSRGPEEADSLAKALGWQYITYDWQAKI